MNATTNNLRAEMYARADYYTWAARRQSPPCGADPMTGRPWDGFTFHRSTAARLGRASYAAMARECYRIARTFPQPLPASTRCTA